MLTLDRVRELLGQPDLPDREAAEIRDYLRALAELAFDKWRQERAKNREAQAGEAIRPPQGYENTKEGRPTEGHPSQPL